MDNKIRIQDDLYNHVNQEWLETAVIPDDRPTTGGFADIDKAVEELLTADFKKMIAGEIAIPSEHLRNACELFKIVNDVKKRNKLGIKPIVKTLKKIDGLKDVANLNRNLADYVLNRMPLPFDIDVDVDMKDTSRHVVMIGVPSTFLPDASYYKEGMEAQHDALFSVWTSMVQKLLGYTYLTEEQVGKYVEDAIKFDALIAGLVKTNEELSEYTKLYNPMSTRTVSGLLKPFKFRNVLEKLFGDAPETVIVMEPRYMKAFNTVFNQDTFELYKHWAFVKVVLSYAGTLSEEIRETSTIFYKAISGVVATPSIEKQAYGLTSAFFSEPIGLYYGDKYFGQKAKNDIVSIVKEIIKEYEVRIKENDFLSAETKAKAIVKLDKMEIKMGYPDKVDPIFDKFIVQPNDTIHDVMSRFVAIKMQYAFSKLNETVDRGKWVMPGHMVNACYNPSINDITFPAAILQPPFYSINQTRSENLGGIGAIIGHEISHAFDNNGSRCDEFGNLNNWWTKEDFKKFNQKTKAMIKEFEGIELPWGKVNASFIVSENIADNGGMAVTLNIMKHTDGADYEKYFCNWAKVWAMKARPEYLSLLLQIDVHAPAILRANMQPRNFDEWYDTFKVTSKDKMYIPAKKRVVIW